MSSENQHELNGIAEWWLPDNPDQKVAGSLTFDEEKGATVQLLGVLHPETDLTIGKIRRGTLVFGRDARGRMVTLLDAVSTRHQTNYADGEERICQDLTARVVLMGQTLPSSPPEFSASTFSFEGLAEWTNSHFKLLRSPNDEGNRDEESPRFGVLVHNAPPITFPISSGKLTLWAAASSSHSITRQDYSVHTSWHYEPSTPMTLEQLLDEVITPLEHLHLLLTAEPTNLIRLDLELPTVKEDNYLPRTLKVFAAWSKSPVIAGRHFWDWSVRFDDIVDRIEDLVNRWLALSQEVKYALVLLFSILDRKKDFYLQHRYLTICQAAETYHRHRTEFPHRILDEQEHSQRLAHILDNTPRGWHEWIKPRLNFAYEPTFRQRLRDMAAYVRDFGARVLAPSSINAIVDARNDLTHGLDRRESDEDLEVMVLLSEKLIMVMRACLLRDLGFAVEELPDRLLRNEYSGFVADQQPPRR